MALYTAFILSLLPSTGSIATTLNGTRRVASGSSSLTEAHTPTGPNPIIATVRIISSVVKPTSGPVRAGEKHRGQGRPVSTGITLGWLRAWSAANTPVGKISASIRRELSAILDRACSLSSGESALDQVFGLLRLNRVPPPLGTR